MGKPKGGTRIAGRGTGKTSANPVSRRSCISSIGSPQEPRLGGGGVRTDAAASYGAPPPRTFVLSNRCTCDRYRDRRHAGVHLTTAEAESRMLSRQPERSLGMSSELIR